MSRMNQILLARRAPMIGHLGAYANNLSALIPDVWAALDVVSRELSGFIPSVNRSATAERAAVGQTVPFPIAPAMAAYDVTPAMAIPEPPDVTPEVGTMAITKSRAVPFGFTGEEQRALNAGAAPGYVSLQAGMIAQALRTLTNEIEGDLAAAAAAGASRAWGDGTTPFATDDLSPIAQLRRILNENGAPQTGRSLVLDGMAASNLITVKNLSRVNESGTQMTLRQGELLDVYGFSIKESGASVQHTAGTGASATTDNAGYAVGDTVITLASAGTGTILAGDYVSFAGDTNKYVVVSGDADVSGGGTITIAQPGLRVAIPTAATAVTVGEDYTANVAFSADAMAVAMRPPAQPVEGDARLDSMLVTDPRSGVTFELSIWPGYRKVRGEVALAWGTKAVKSAHIALLAG